jgi:hypothetical protein
MIILPHESHEIRYSLNTNALAQLLQFTLSQHNIYNFPFLYITYQPRGYIISERRGVLIYVSERSFFIFIIFEP